MTSDGKMPDPYEAVLSDLRAKREQIDQAIQVLEAVRSGSAAPIIAAGTVTPAGEPADAAGAYLGLTIPDAAKKLLAARKRSMGNPEISAALKAGGLALQSKDPINTIGSVLTRRFNDVGDIVRVGRGTWGLAEWYPNRSFKKKAGKDENGGEAKTETSAPVSPSAPKPGAAQG